MVSNSEVPTHTLEQYKYLEGTNHLDPDDGLLYKVLSVEEKNYPGQGRLIVCYRAHVYPNGKVSMKASKTPITCVILRIIIMIMSIRFLY